MKTNYRKLFVKTVSGIDDPVIAKLVKFSTSKPIPCWGGIYKKVYELNLTFKQKKSLMDIWIQNQKCSRFIGLLLYMNRRDESFFKMLMKYYNRLPEYLQIYVAALPKGRSILNQIKKPPSPEIIKIINNHESISKEVQMTTAKFKKLLRFDLAPGTDNPKN